MPNLIGNAVLGAVSLPPTVPLAVSMRQAKLALLAAGTLDQVDAVVASADRATQIEWQYASDVRHDDPHFQAVATALGWTQAQLDDLFIAASQL